MIAGKSRERQRISRQTSVKSDQLDCKFSSSDDYFKTLDCLCWCHIKIYFLSPNRLHYNNVETLTQ